MIHQIRPRGFGTIVNHAGEHDDSRFSHTMPIYQTSTFGFSTGEDAAEVLEGSSPDRYVYTRGGNPNARHLARKIAQLEGADLIAAASANPADEVVAAEITSSGIAAISTLAFALLKAGDTAIVQHITYGGSMAFWESVAPRHGINVVFVDGPEIEKWERALEANPQARLVYIETPSTPLLFSYDLRKIAALSHAIGAELAVDNTAATPYHQRPLNQGADHVVISTTKYMNGHGVQIGGAIVTRHPELCAIGGAIWTALTMYGATPSPHDCWLTNNGLKTLELRMQRHAENAMGVAQFLEGHRAIDRVYYPGLPSMQDHDLAKSQMQNGYSGLISFTVNGSGNNALAFLNALTLPIIAASFGTTDTLVQHPYSMSHSYMKDEQKARSGITTNLIRMSVGIENLADLIEDTDRALRVAVRSS
jgi:methionine-gamma-lyase